MVTDFKKQGKKNRQAGARFELKVRKDLEEKWIVSKWMNNVELNISMKRDIEVFGSRLSKPTVIEKGQIEIENNSKLIPAKHKFRGPGIPMVMGTGFPDFIAFTTFGGTNILHTEFGEIEGYHCVIGVECKSNGYLTKEEKEKCKWLFDNNIFSKILIAKKGTKRGEIIYEDFMERKK